MKSPISHFHNFFYIQRLVSLNIASYNQVLLSLGTQNIRSIPCIGESFKVLKAIHLSIPQYKFP